MIKPFRSRRLHRFWRDGRTEVVDQRHVAKLRRQLATLDVASTPQGMDVPGWRFHALRGQDKGRWSGDGPDAVDVDYEDYH